MNNNVSKIPRCLGICLFFNDDDIVSDAIQYLLNNNHEVVVFDHSSKDNTLKEIQKYASKLLEVKVIPSDVHLNEIFEIVSRYIIDNYANDYDWISFPESDEFLEGPDRSKTYFEYVVDIFNSEYDWMDFTNVIYWFTEKDDVSIQSPYKRLKYYCVRYDCIPRMYSWRASAMNIRWFNHNAPDGKKSPVNFNTCHYQMRSEAQMHKRIALRTGLSDKNINYHFDYMARNVEDLYIKSEELHFDDGVSDLNMKQIFDWKQVYGTYDLLVKQVAQEASFDNGGVHEI